MKPYIYPFEKLEVYHLAKQLISLTYKLCENMPKSENYILASQVKRAALSITANIAEGAGRATANDRAHFINLAYSSALECISHISLVCQLNLIEPQKEKEYRLLVNQVTLKLNRYYQYHLRKRNHLREVGREGER